MVSHGRAALKWQPCQRDGGVGVRKSAFCNGGFLSCGALSAKDKAFKIFTIFDDDQNDALDYHEFLKHIFPKESCERCVGSQAHREVGHLKLVSPVL